MMTARKIKPLWATVKVIRGFVDDVVLFDSYEAASKTEERWRARSNPDYDEVAVIKARIGKSVAGMPYAPGCRRPRRGGA